MSLKFIIDFTAKHAIIIYSVYLVHFKYQKTFGEIDISAMISNHCTSIFHGWNVSFKKKIIIKKTYKWFAFKLGKNNEKIMHNAYFFSESDTLGNHNHGEASGYKYFCRLFTRMSYTDTDVAFHRKKLISWYNFAILFSWISLLSIFNLQYWFGIVSWKNQEKDALDNNVSVKIWTKRP